MSIPENGSANFPSGTVYRKNFQGNKKISVCVHTFLSLGQILYKNFLN
ncbi:hypothetical protein L9Z41_09000 [Leptospira noguchii]|nr:hypothetical protein [Leptospira noguchii]MCH1912106.1 hypothetical protein [Leptospira noguchii]MCH1915768.1 hypothetical protein [Leptospira noguchii]UOG63220.1 hypothetical protein MAL04_12885 [Leptospira noguchii]